MIVLGVSALYHDSAAAIIRDGVIVAASQEERFSRIKHDKRLPVNAIEFCLREAHIGFSEVDVVAYYDNPILTLQRFVENLGSIGNKEATLYANNNIDEVFGDRVWIKSKLQSVFGPMKNEKAFIVCKHHMSHAASAFYPSPFDKAMIITNDGVGEWDTSTIGIGDENDIIIVKTIKYPHSIGMLYSAFTFFCGFKVNEGDYKFMGLAPYGEPIYYDWIRKEIINIKDDGSYRLNLEYFDYYNGRSMISDKLERKLGERRRPETRITKREMDLASSVQKVIEEIIIKQAYYARKLNPDINNLVLAGGCALNCVANGKLIKEGVFDNVWIQPASGDAGGALGCALYAYYKYLGNNRKLIFPDGQNDTYLGIQYDDDEIEKVLKDHSAVYKKYEEDKITEYIAKDLSKGKIIGHFNGRAEFGPRALGNRSIIADARFSDMQSKMNLKIKFRESFRPFAPAVLRERVNEYFDMDNDSPYMLIVSNVKESIRKPFSLKKTLEYSDNDMIPIVNEVRSTIPAVTHVDYSARIQTVTEDRNKRFYSIIKNYEALTGCAVIVNTSFNVRGEPIVNSPEDAYRCFMRTNMDALAIGHFLLYKEDQPKMIDDVDWRNLYELD